MWRPRPGKPGPVKLAASRSAGHPCPPQGQARKRAHSVRPCPGHSPRSVAALVHPPAPAPLCGADGRARASGLRPPAARSGLRSRRQPLPPTAAEPGLSAGGSLACAPSGAWPSRSPPALRGGNLYAAR